ncbi:GCN5 family acetyltransferase [Actinoplanes sp. SE50]|uniref:GNAT family N-acetyltransferase n=1 Tax=unclassified Actinoplanes TaxID=2626549 RepID=UPI00023ECB20|nr:MULTISPECIES: GNAT family N-acetyltransferase [unclassified Actinoplanes]AEV84288.1 phosphinothricin acetyltransferase [Actinoplanes sp. SE50/110]ATO82680.1 GCN5 family acetyltransferase [Actinoplanes sp. SE50]SLM00087.1 GCN5 family acetyltransferase [Actinoplanes sp. SE50/110]
MPLTIRSAGEADAAACAAVYRPYVLDTAITFESDPPSDAEMARRIAAAVRSHAWLVAEDDGEIIGYAYAGPFAARPAYRWSCEVSVYLAVGRRRTGAGRALYRSLLPRLIDRGYRVAVAKTTLPNEASMGLHAALGFQLVGVHRNIGWKNGDWHDVAITQLDLVTDSEPPVEPC